MYFKKHTPTHTYIKKTSHICTQIFHKPNIHTRTYYNLTTYKHTLCYQHHKRTHTLQKSQNIHNHTSQNQTMQTTTDFKTQNIKTTTHYKTHNIHEVNNSQKYTKFIHYKNHTNKHTHT